MKPKDIVHYYEVKIDFDKNDIFQTHEKYKVLGVNLNKLVIEDDNFTVIKHKKLYRGDFNIVFNQTNINESHFEPYWNYIKCYLYTLSSSEKIAYRRIKKSLEKYIYEKHGRYCNALEFLDKIKT